MSYTVKLSRTAKKQLTKLEQDIQERIIAGLQRCHIKPQKHVKKLVASPYYRLRIGDYRVIIDIKNNELTILVIEIGHRKNVYK